MKQLNYDSTLMMSDRVGRYGITHKELRKQQIRAMKAHKAAHAFLDTGEQGFVKNLASSSHTREIQQAAAKARKTFSELLVIGIGGSDLGARALHQALSQKGKQVVHFLGDTVDPAAIRTVLQKVKWKQCLLNPVSKSGNTVETLSVFLAAHRELVKHVGGRAAKHVLVTTEKNGGALHKLAEAEHFQILAHPKNIGGRWSILSNVGLLSAAFCGADIAALRKGALAFYRMAKKDADNPAMRYARLHALGAEKGQSIAVLMPYASRLESLGGWYRQLFGESLSKARNRKGKMVHSGLTPVLAMGPRDQHSQIQLYNEGPFDKLITFLTAGGSDNLRIPKRRGYLDLAGGKTFQELLLAEQKGTVLGLAAHHRPSGTIHLPQIDEYHLGQLIMFFELACVYLAEFFDINAFDQPGVEEGKKQMLHVLAKND